MILSALKSANEGNNKQAKQTYLSFADFRTRVVYLFSIIKHLNVFNSIGNEVIDDYEKLKTVANDQDILLLLDNGIRNAKTQIKLERQTAQTLQSVSAKA